MNKPQPQTDFPRRTYSARRVARHRQDYFEMIRRTTVNYASAPARRASRKSSQAPDIDNLFATYVLQFGIVLAMVVMVMLFRVPLAAAMFSALPAGLVSV